MAETKDTTGRKAGVALLVSLRHAQPRLTNAMRVVTYLGSTAVVWSLGACAFVALYLARRRRAALLLLITMAGAAFLNAMCLFGTLAAVLSHRVRGTAARVAVWASAALVVTLVGLLARLPWRPLPERRAGRVRGRIRLGHVGGARGRTAPPARARVARRGSRV
jgi:hypothetical protein